MHFLDTSGLSNFKKYFGTLSSEVLLSWKKPQQLLIPCVLHCKINSSMKFLVKTRGGGGGQKYSPQNSTVVWLSGGFMKCLENQIYVPHRSDQRDKVVSSPFHGSSLVLELLFYHCCFSWKPLEDFLLFSCGQKPFGSLKDLQDKILCPVQLVKNSAFWMSLAVWFQTHHFSLHRVFWEHSSLMDAWI